MGSGIKQKKSDLKEVHGHWLVYFTQPIRNPKQLLGQDLEQMS